MRALTWPIRFLSRFALASKFYFRLGYTWHLAWWKAVR